MRGLRWFATSGVFVLFLGLMSSAGGQDAKAERFNLRIDVSAALIDAYVRSSSDQVEPFEETDDDTQIRGWRRTTVKARAYLVPDPLRAAAYIQADGQVHSRALATRGIARLCTDANISFQAQHGFAMDARGLQIAPGVGSASAWITLLDAADLEGDRDSTAARLATLNFERNRLDIQDRVAARTRREAIQRQYEQVSRPLLDFTNTVGNTLQDAYQQGLKIESLRFSTTAERVQADVAIASDLALAPAPARPEAADLSVRIHHSVVNQIAEALLRGKTLEIKNVSETVERATSLFLADGRGAEEQARARAALEKQLAQLKQPPALITYASERPLSVEFQPGHVRVTQQIAGFRLEGVDYGGLRLRAKYNIERTATGFSGVREGLFEVEPYQDPASPKKLEPPGLAYKLLLFSVANEVVKPRWDLKELAPVREARNVVSLRQVSARSTDGWLTLAWGLDP